MEVLFVTPFNSDRWYYVVEHISIIIGHLMTSNYRVRKILSS